MLTVVLAMGALAALAIIIIMHKIGIRKFCGYSVHADILISGVFTILFLGTFAGMVSALVAGIFVSLYLAMAKYFRGYEKWSFKKGWYRGDTLNN